MSYRYGNLKPDMERAFVEFLKSACGWLEGISPEEYWERRRADPGFRGDGVLVASDESGGIVGGVAIIDRHLQIGGRITLSVGGLTNVCTDPRHRRRGICRSLIERAFRIYREGGIFVAALCTEYPEAEEVYRRLGYAVVSTNYLLRIAPVSESKVELKPCGEEAAGTICTFFQRRVTDHSCVPVKYDVKSWRYRRFRSLLLEPGEEVLLIEDRGRAVGYAIVGRWKGEPMVLDLCLQEGSPLLEGVLLSLARRLDSSLLPISVGDQMPFFDRLAPRSESQTKLDVAMVKLLSLRRFLRAISPLLERRWPGGAELSISNPQEDVWMRIGRGGRRIKISGGISDIQSLILGVREARQLAEEGGIEISPPDEVGVVSQIFPRMNWFLPLADHW
ncbi:MAG: GNAT family N-acetyltransferase [bacterium]